MPSSPTDREAPSRVQFCSLVSEASGEDLIGSAWSVPCHVAVELPLPWPYEVLAGTHVPAGLKEFVYGVYGAGIPWGFLGIAPDPERSVEGHTRILFCDRPAGPVAGYDAWELLVPNALLIATLERLRDAWPHRPAGLDRFTVERPAGLRDILVCTHGAVDACCAKFGYPVYRELSRLAAQSATNTRVWRCTHFGGHRFAATVLELPSGRYWGRLTGARLGGLIDHDLPAVEMRNAYRGWALLPHVLEQVAEGEAFRRGGWEWTECVMEASGAPDDPEAIAGIITFTYRHPGGEEGSIVIEVIPTETISTMASSSSPEMQDVQQFRCEVRSVSPAGGILDRDPDAAA